MIALRTALAPERGRLAVRFHHAGVAATQHVWRKPGLVIADGALRILRTLEIRGLPRLDEVSLDPRALAFAVGAALITGVLCGFAPALQMPVLGIATALREGDRQAGASRRHGRLRSILVTAEIALAFVLVVGATLLARSFHALLNEHRGFQTNHRLVFSISYPDSYGQNGVGKEFIDRFLGELSVIPGVVSSGAVNVRPVQGPNYGMGVSAASPAGRRLSTLGRLARDHARIPSAQPACRCCADEFSRGRTSLSGPSRVNRRRIARSSSVQLWRRRCFRTRIQSVSMCCCGKGSSAASMRKLLA